MSLISNVYSFKFFIEPLGCLCSKEEVGRMPRRCAATKIDIQSFSLVYIVLFRQSFCLVRTATDVTDVVNPATVTPWITPTLEMIKFE